MHKEERFATAKHPEGTFTLEGFLSIPKSSPLSLTLVHWGLQEHILAPEVRVRYRQKQPRQRRTLRIDSGEPIILGFPTSPRKYECEDHINARSLESILSFLLFLK